MATRGARSKRSRGIRTWIGGLAFFLLLAAGGVAFVTGTTAGGRLVVSFITHRLPEPLQVEVGDFSGRLADRFELRSVRLSLPEAEVAADRVAIDWRLAGLLRRRAHARSIRVEGVDVRLMEGAERGSEAPAARADSAGPAAPPLSDLPVQLSVDSLTLMSVKVRQSDSVWVEGARVKASGAPGDYGLELSGLVSVPGLPAATVQLSGRGSNRALRVDSLAASVLEGALSAAGTVSWWPKISWDVAVVVDSVHPAELAPDPGEWPGSLSSRASAVGRLTDSGTLETDVTVDTVHGTLRGEPVAGALSVRLEGRELDIRQANLAWGPAEVQASGTAAQSLDLAFDLLVPDLGLLMPGSAGRVTARGRAAGARASPTISATFQANRVRVEDLQVEAASGDAEIDLTGPLRASIEARRLRLAGYDVDSATLALTGRRSAHRLEATARGSRVELEVTVAGSLGEDGVWTGTVEALDFTADTLGSWRLADPTDVRAGHGELRVDRACLESLPTRVCAEGTYGGGAFQLAATVDSLDLADAGRFAPEGLSVQAVVDADAQLELAPREGLRGTVGIQTGPGTLTRAAGGETRTLRFAPATLTAEAGSEGVRGQFELHLTDSAAVRLLDATGRLETPVVIRSTADLTTLRGHPVSVHAKIGSEDLAFLSRAFLPRWEVAGKFDASADLDISAEGGLEGHLAATTEGLTARNTARARGWTLTVDPARLEVEVGPDGASGTADLVVSSAEGGDLLTAAGRIRLPSFTSLDFDPGRQPVEGSLEIRVDNLEIIPAFMLDVAEARGSFLLTTRFGGTLAAVTVDGEATLSDGYALLPAFGLELKDIGLHAEGRPDGRIEVNGQLRSGEGLLTLSGRSERYPSPETPTVFQVRGDRVRVADIPQVDILASPQLDLAFDGSHATITGDVLIPRARLGFPEIPPTAVVPSEDVVIVGDTVTQREPPVPVTADIQVSLGDDVTFNGFGFAAQLQGGIRITQDAGEEPVGRGEVRFVNGTYRSFGQELRIDPGSLRFGGPLDDPAVDARAYVRATDGTEAGLRIGGTVQNLDVSTYSVPPKTDSDIMSYILFGRPMSETSGSEGNQASNTAAVLGANMLAMSLAPSVGLDEARIDTGSSQNKAQLVVGKYLSPKLYVGYGVGLYEPISTFRLRYLLTSRWSIEAITGDQQSTDLLWRIETGGPKITEETGAAGGESPSPPAEGR